MTTDSDAVLCWIKQFKYTWLPQNVANDCHLFEPLTNKINELEKLLTGNIQDDDEALFDLLCEPINTVEIEPAVSPTAQSNEHVFFTPPDKNNQIEHEDEKQENTSRPVIRLQRIPLADAELYVPLIWQAVKPKRGRKKGAKSNPKPLTAGLQPIRTSRRQKRRSSAVPDENQPDVSLNEQQQSNPIIQNPSTTSINSVGDERKKTKRKLRALEAEDDDLFTLGNISRTDHRSIDNGCDPIPRYIGQNGILSQTRKINETSNDDDFPIILQSRQMNHNNDKNLHQKSSSLSNDVSNKTTEPISAEPLPITNDNSTVVDDQTLKHANENHSNDSIFSSLNITHDKTFDTNLSGSKSAMMNYIDCIEDISNDGIDPPPTLSSTNLSHISLTT